MTIDAGAYVATACPMPQRKPSLKVAKSVGEKETCTLLSFTNPLG